MQDDTPTNSDILYEFLRWYAERYEHILGYKNMAEHTAEKYMRMDVELFLEERERNPELLTKEVQDA